MTAPLGSKLFIPRLQHPLVARPRLAELLRLGSESRLALISAPAGFGKTTLLADWAAAARPDERSVAWLSLDARDDDPVSFWTAVISALNRASGSVALDLSVCWSQRYDALDRVVRLPMQDRGIDRIGILP